MSVKRSMGLLMMAASLVPMLVAQGSFWNTPEAYLGQTPPSDIPKAFAPMVLLIAGDNTLHQMTNTSSIPGEQVKKTVQFTGFALTAY
jgi:hypothetical protein